MHFAVGSFFLELMKLGAVSDDQARRSLDRLDQLEKNAPTGGQVARYGVLGAGAGALSHAVSRTIEKGHFSPRSVAGAAAAGAIGMGAVPLVRGVLDRHAEKKTLKNYLAQPAEKTGATLKDLQGAYKRIAPLRNKVKPSAKILEHVMTAENPAALGIREMSAMTGPGTLPRQAQMGMLQARPAIMAENARALGAGAEDAEGIRQTALAQVAGTKSYVGNAGGAIMMPPGGMSGWTARAQARAGSPIEPPAGAAQQRAANILTGVHEGYERSTKNSPAPYFSHFSPSVMHKEHNMIAGLQGPGADEGRSYFQGMRAGQEATAHASQLQSMYGDKAAPWATYGEGPKLPKAMRKDMIRNWSGYQAHEREKLRELAGLGAQEVEPGGIPFEGKIAAGAPTRGGFMMASDMPPFRSPQLGAAIQKTSGFDDYSQDTTKSDPPGMLQKNNLEPEKEKNSDALPNFVTYGPGDFPKSKYAVAGLTPASQLEKSTSIGAPKVSAPPGPSIADQVKPRGKAFGIGMPGAFKTKIG